MEWHLKKEKKSTNGDGEGCGVAWHRIGMRVDELHGVIDEERDDENVE